MFMYNPETGYIANIDNTGPNHNESLGFDAEDLVIDFLNNQFPDLEIRHSTIEEDSGVRQITKGKQIDAVAYMGGLPAMVMQITTARDPKVRAEKMTQLKDHPFVRLDEMKPQDTSVPKVLISVGADSAEAYLKDRDFSKHPEIFDDILRGIVNSLNFDLIMTKNPKERTRVTDLLGVFGRKNVSNN